MKYGLSEKQLNEIIAILSTFTEIEEAILFGSRAIDTYKEASDVDIALKGDKVTASLAAKLKYQFEEDTYLPFFFDFVAYTTITNEALKEHIDTKGVLIYRAGWRECKLGDVIISNAQSITKDYPHKTIRYLDTGSITCGKIHSIQEYSLKSAPSRAKRLAKEHDIVYSTVRPIQRHYGYIVNPPENLVVSTGFAVIETNKKLAEPFFIYNFLSSKDIIETLDSIAEGSTSAYPSLKPSDIESLDILLPPLPEQRAIASVLSSLDNKIDLLHRQNKTLEAMAETLFRQWFVGEAEEGWEEGKLGDVADFNNGKSRPESIEGSVIPIYGGNGILGYTIRLNSEGMSIVIGRVGAYCGSLYIENRPIWITDNALSAKPKDKKYTSYLYYLLKSLNLNQMAEGSSHPLLTQTLLNTIDITIPSDDIITAFCDFADSILMKSFFNKHQICTINKLRDILLPKLMSGEVRVSL